MKHKGFTLIEIALFLAITGVLFMGIIAGTGNSLYEQRFNDSVQSFAELLRSVYSQVSNPQSIGDGRSDTAIYGKLISFGQKVGLMGEDLDSSEQVIFIYDVVGKVNTAGEGGTGSVTDALKQLNANVAVVKEQSNGVITKMEPAGEVESYMPRWGAAIEKTEIITSEPDRQMDLFTGSILVVRHPRSGTIHTLYSEEIIEVNENLEKGSQNEDYEEAINMLTNVLSTFKTQELDFCVDPNGTEVVSNNNRRDIRLVNNARNASGVEIIDLDSNENKCRF